jgi:hypothetical protein
LADTTFTTDVTVVTADWLNDVNDLVYNKSGFLGTFSSSANVTGDGTAVTVFSDTEVYDISADFVHTTSVFTARYTGYHSFHLSMVLQGLTSSHTSAELSLVTNNRNYPLHGGNYGAMKNASDELYVSGGMAWVNMTAGHTASFSLTVSGGAKVIDLSSVRISGGLQRLA